MLANWALSKTVGSVMWSLRRGISNSASAAPTMPGRCPPQCRYYLRGFCRHGAACRFSHSTTPAQQVNPELPFHHRHFVEAASLGRGTGGAAGLRVMSYNILASQYAREHAEELYSTVPWKALDWPRRAALLAAEVAHWRPDVVCMQEVDHYEDVEAALLPHGYTGVYAQRTGGRLDGLATFWRHDRLKADAIHCIEFAPLGLKDNVTQLVVLRWRQSDSSSGREAPGRVPIVPTSSTGSSGSGGHKRERAVYEDAATSAAAGHPRPTAQHIRFGSSDEEDEGDATGGQNGEDAAGSQGRQPHQHSGRPAGGKQVADDAELAGGLPCLVVANIHVLFNPKRGDIKLAQVRTMLEAAHALAVARRAAVVCCGDFNSAAGSPLHEFVLRGELDLGQTERRKVSGQVEVAGRSGWPHIQRSFLWELERVERSTDGLAAGPALCEAAALAAALNVLPPYSSVLDPHNSLREPRLLASDGAARRMMRPAASPATPTHGGDDSGGLRQLLYRTESSSSASSSSRSSGGGSARVRPWSLDELRLAVGEAVHLEGPATSNAASTRQTYLARHPLRLSSAYLSVLGREPLYTTVHDKYVGTVDYILYTPQPPAAAAADGAGREGAASQRPLNLRAVRVLQPPPLRTLRFGLPCPAWPSDHISLVADFEIG